ncbi:hypothetical protein A5884_001418, partial [Enterococcus sp. 7D2_DIV0200]
SVAIETIYRELYANPDDYKILVKPI